MEVTKEKMLNVVQVSTMLGIHPSTLATYRCYQTGGPAYIKNHRRRIFYPETAVRHYAKAQGIEIVEL